MIKILRKSNTITESLLDNIARDVDEILTPLKVKYSTDYDGDSLKIEFDDSEVKIKRAIKALEKDKYSVLSREGEYWVRFKTPSTDTKSDMNHKLAHPQGDGGARYWVYKVDTDMHSPNSNYNDVGKVMYVRKDSNSAKYQTAPEDRKTFTQNSAQRKIDHGNSYGDGRFKWFKIKAESIEESFDTHNSNVEYLNSLFDEYVPSNGLAPTKLGEVIRAVARIVYRYLNDGDCIGVTAGIEYCNPSAAYLADNTNSTISKIITNALWGVSSNDLYEDALTDLVSEVAEYVREGFDELVAQENSIDSRDYSVDEKYSKYDYPDEDDSEESDEDEYDPYFDEVVKVDESLSDNLRSLAEKGASYASQLFTRLRLMKSEESGLTDEDLSYLDKAIDVMLKYYRRRPAVEAKSLRENIQMTEHVQLIGDVIDGFIGNMEDDDIDFTIAIYKKVARILGVKDYNKIVVSVNEDEIDPKFNSQVKVSSQKLKMANKNIDMTEHTVATDPQIVFIRELCSESGSVYLYFTSEEDYDRYVEVVRSTSSEE